MTFCSNGLNYKYGPRLVARLLLPVLVSIGLDLFTAKSISITSEPHQTSRAQVVHVAAVPE